MTLKSLLGFGLLGLSVMLTACSEESGSSGNMSASPAGKVVGGDRDANGCIGSAGYQWCASLNKCVRPWEIAKQQGFENTPDSFTAYCQKPER